MSGKQPVNNGTPIVKIDALAHEWCSLCGHRGPVFGGFEALDLVPRDVDLDGRDLGWQRLARAIIGV
jgi:hypothetical protein